MTRWTPTLALALAACGELDHADYVDERAAAECRNYQACALGFFEASWRDAEDCLDDRADDLDDADDDLPSACDYDGEEARRCVSRINALSCEEFAEGAVAGACDLVWVCNG